MGRQEKKIRVKVVFVKKIKNKKNDKKNDLLKVNKKREKKKLINY